MSKSSNLLLFLLASLLLNSCTFEKRLYTKGYHVDWVSNNSSPKKTTQENANRVDKAPHSKSTKVDASEKQPKESWSPTADYSTPLIEPASANREAVTTCASCLKSQGVTTTINDYSNTRKETKVSASDVVPENKKLKRKLIRRFADDTVLYVILALLLPPLAVFLYEGQNWTDKCTLNLILTILCWLPGVVHALLVILDNR